jgi:hypothetical protein
MQEAWKSPKCTHVHPMGLPDLNLSIEVCIVVRSSGRRSLGDACGTGSRAPLAKSKNPPKNHRNLTFRLDSSMMDAVRRDSEEEGFSLNSLANRQFRQYTEWDRLEGKIGFTTVRHRAFRAMLAKLSDQEVAALGREQGPAEAREYILLRWRTITLGNFVRFLDTYGKFATQYNFVHHAEGGGHLVIFAHSLGAKWSIYLEAFMTSALRDLFGIGATSSRTDESLAVSFPVPGPAHEGH